MFGFGRTKKNLSESERLTNTLALVSTGCLFIFMVSRRISDSQTYLLLSSMFKMLDETDPEKLAYRLTDQLAMLNEMDPYSIVSIFKKGLDLKLYEREYILSICISCALLDRDRVGYLIGITDNYAREMGISPKRTKKLLHAAIEDISFYEIIGKSSKDNKPKQILEKALLRTAILTSP